MKPDEMRRVPVTVVVPCYCCGSTIARAIESVAAQTVLPEQVIVVDDGSRDDGATLAELSRLKGHYDGLLPIEVISLPENIGVAGARNTGWDGATQPYVAFLDSDDAWHPRKLEVQYGYLEDNPDVVLCGHAHRVLKPAELPDWKIDPSDVAVVSKLEMLLSNRFNPTSAMIRKEAPYRFMQSRRYMEDHLLWLEILSDGGRVDRLRARLAATYKRPFGDNGLSASLWQMERSELSNYRLLHRSGRLSLFSCYALMAFSLLKFFRRIALVMYWRARGKKPA